MTYWLPIQFQFGSTIRCRFTFFTETEVKFSSGFFQFQSGSTISTGLICIIIILSMVSVWEFRSTWAGRTD